MKDQAITKDHLLLFALDFSAAMGQFDNDIGRSLFEASIRFDANWEDYQKAKAGTINPEKPGEFTIEPVADLREYATKKINDILARKAKQGDILANMFAPTQKFNG